MNNQQMMSNGAPVFTAPTPTFEPPKRMCYYHSNDPAVAQCAKCGKLICQDCYENYGVTDGEYAGQALCYDCCKELVADNVAELTKNKKKVKFHFILSIIGMAIGFIIGMAAGISEGSFGGGLYMGIILALLGGMFWDYMKFYLAALWESFKMMFTDGVVAAVIACAIAVTIGGFKAMWYTIKNTFFYIKYLKETQGFIESDSEALRQMEDYMQYTMIRNKNRGVDLETLLSQQSELANNSYARMVQEKGEEGAEAELRRCVATINENGEIIRSFDEKVA